MSSSELQREAASAKVRCEEVEHQKKAKLLLKTQEIELQSTIIQFKLDVVDRENHQKLAEATIEKAKNVEDASKISGFCQSMLKL